MTLQKVTKRCFSITIDLTKIQGRSWCSGEGTSLVTYWSGVRIPPTPTTASTYVLTWIKVVSKWPTSLWDVKPQSLLLVLCPHFFASASNRRMFLRLTFLRTRKTSHRYAIICNANIWLRISLSTQIIFYVTISSSANFRLRSSFTIQRKFKNSTSSLECA